MFDLIYKGPTTYMYPVMECNGNFFALTIYYNQLTLELLQAFAVDKCSPASLCSGVRDEPDDPQCIQM